VANLQIITSNENQILEFIKGSLDDYPESIGYDSIRDVLELSETRLVELLESLEEKSFIRLDEDSRRVYYADLDVDVEVVKNKSALRRYMLNRSEEDAYSIIKEVIMNYGGLAPRFALEGALLYGSLEFTPKRTYNVMVSLENKNLLNRVLKNDGEYYTV